MSQLRLFDVWLLVHNRPSNLSVQPHHPTERIPVGRDNWMSTGAIQPAMAMQETCKTCSWSVSSPLCLADRGSCSDSLLCMCETWARGRSQEESFAAREWYVKKRFVIFSLNLRYSTGTITNLLTRHILSRSLGKLRPCQLQTYLNAI